MHGKKIIFLHRLYRLSGGGALHTPCYSRLCKDNKHVSYQEARKLVVGELERNIIEYAVTQGRRFSAALVVTYYHKSAEGKERIRLLKRYHDAIKRLERRGLVKKIGRGIYELAKDLGLSDIAEPKERVGTPAAQRSPRRGERRTLVRIHIAAKSGDGYIDMYYKLAILHYVSGCLLAALEEYLLRIGVSKSRLRRVKQRARAVAAEVCRAPKVAGVHGAWGRALEGVAPIEAISKLRVHYSEIGFDVLVPAELPKIFVKFYTKPLGKNSSLEKWFGG